MTNTLALANQTFSKTMPKSNTTTESKINAAKRNNEINVLVAQNDIPVKDLFSDDSDVLVPLPPTPMNATKTPNKVAPISNIDPMGDTSKKWPVVNNDPTLDSIDLDYLEHEKSVTGDPL